jgi:hypothetical protein
MHIHSLLFRKIVINHQIYILDIDSSSENVCCNHNSVLIFSEEIIEFDSLGLWQFRMDTDWVKHLQSQYFSD